jgi:hypothetical protein
MKYATWKLNFNNSSYGIGPEHEIIKQGFTAAGAYLQGEALNGTILGYFTGEPENLEPWGFSEITQPEALAFAVALDPTAYLLADGSIATISVNRGE